MPRCALFFATFCAFLAGPVGPALADLTELGAMEAPVKGSCPEKECRAITRTTAYQAKLGDVRGLMAAPADGRIVAFTLALGKPGPKQSTFFSETFGGQAQAAIVILRPSKNLNVTVIAKSDPVTLTPYFGRRTQFPLIKTLPARKGDVVALTVPTWAPVLALGLEGKTSWRSSQAKDGCADTQTQSALVGTRAAAQFNCLFRNQRLTYSATFVSNPTVDAPKVK